MLDYKQDKLLIFLVNNKAVEKLRQIYSAETQQGAQSISI